jgi:hypothetical protein
VDLSPKQLRRMISMLRVQRHVENDRAAAAEEALQAKKARNLLSGDCIPWPNGRRPFAMRKPIPLNFGIAKAPTRRRE